MSFCRSASLRVESWALRLIETKAMKASPINSYNSSTLNNQLLSLSPSVKPKLLIVDDDEEIRTQMKWAVGQDYDVLLAGDRAEALETFGSLRPAVTILDLGLPPRPNDPEEGFGDACPTCLPWIGPPRSSSSPDRRKRRTLCEQWVPEPTTSYASRSTSNNLSSSPAMLLCRKP